MIRIEYQEDVGTMQVRTTMGCRNGKGGVDDKTDEIKARSFHGVRCDPPVDFSSALDAKRDDSSADIEGTVHTTPHATCIGFLRRPDLFPCALSNRTLRT